MPDYASMNQLLFEGKAPEVQRLTEEALAAGRDVREVLNDGLIAGMNVVGEDFKRNRVYLPEVVLSARAMKAGMTVLKGDLHDIGKSLVLMMAEGAGFTCVNLGTNTSAPEYIAAVKEHNATILGMSALLTTTMIYMKTVITEMAAAGLGHVKICVGGAPVTQLFADEIGADGYAPDAATAVDLIKKLASATTAPATAG